MITQERRSRNGLNWSVQIIYGWLHDYPAGTNFPEDLIPFAQTFLIDAYSKDRFGGTGELSDWSGFLNWKNKYSSKSWILAGGISSENIKEALSETQANMIDVNSGVETSPGIKDHVKIKKFFRGNFLISFFFK